MQSIQLKYLQLKESVFSGGKNFNLKLYAEDPQTQRPSDLQMDYDPIYRVVIVEYPGKLGREKMIIPLENVASMTPIPLMDLTQALDNAEEKVGGGDGPKPLKPLGRPKKKTAQVSTPHDHVFHEGPGRTHD